MITYVLCITTTRQTIATLWLITEFLLLNLFAKIIKVSHIHAARVRISRPGSSGEIMTGCQGHSVAHLAEG